MKGETVSKMDPAVKAKWLEALRSDEYAQGTFSLRSKEDEFCCLGVLCDIAVKEGIIPEPDPGNTDYIYGREDDAETAGLPRAVQEWSGVPLLGDRGDDHSLAYLNDQGKSFAFIADIIEEEF